MELELKHLAPYLPYGMQFMHQDKSYMLFALELPHDQNPLWITGFNNIESLEGKSELINVHPEGCMPILRPLSDLEKRIDDDENNLTYLAFLGCFTEMDKYYILDHDNIKYQQYYTITQLLEWNFDIFGLIKEGLAIDINTLKQTT